MNPQLAALFQQFLKTNGGAQNNSAPVNPLPISQPSPLTTNSISQLQAPELNINERGVDLNQLKSGLNKASGILGTAMGGLMGFANIYQGINQQKADEYDAKELQEKLNYSAKTVLGQGGLILSEEEFVPVQMEKDENYVTPTLDIYDSKAKKSHEEMDDTTITDVVVSNSLAFSNRKTFKPSDYADIKLGQGFAYYNENGDFELEDVKMKDIFGDSKKDMKFSEAANKIKEYYKVVRGDDKNEDLLTKITNDENRQARLPFINKLAETQKNGILTQGEPFIPQKFGQGGKIKKYSEGDVILGQYGDILAELEEMEQDNEVAFNRSSQDYTALSNRIGARDTLSSLGQLGALASQRTTVSPKLRDTSMANDMFQEVSPALVDQLQTQNFTRGSNLIRNIAQTNPDAAQRIAPRLMDSALGASNQVGLRFTLDNLAQRRNKYKFLNDTQNFNTVEKIRAKEETMNLVNRKKKGLADIMSGFSSKMNTRDINALTLDRQNKANYQNNRNQILQNRLNVNAGRGQLNMNMTNIANQYKLIQQQMDDERIRSRNQRNPQVDPLAIPELGGLPGYEPFTL